jgi:hypothetical protein
MKLGSHCRVFTQPDGMCLMLLWILKTCWFQILVEMAHIFGMDQNMLKHVNTTKQERMIIDKCPAVCE